MKKPPIFIIGCPRSGTTLVRNMLDSHPNICCGPEMHLISKISDFDQDIMEIWERLKIYKVAVEEKNKRLREIFEIFPETYMNSKKKERWAEKTPNNFYYLDFIDKLFPNCQFIHIIRDGRDVVSSFKRRWGHRAIYIGIKEWNKTIDLTFKYRKKIKKERYLEIRYEDLVNKPKIETKKITDFLNEKWSNSMLEHHKFKHDYWFNKQTKKNIDTRKEKKPMRHSPSKPVFSSSVDRWKKDLNFLEKLIVNFYLNNNLRKMKYKP